MDKCQEHQASPPGATTPPTAIFFLTRVTVRLQRTITFYKYHAECALQADTRQLSTSGSFTQSHPKTLCASDSCSVFAPNLTRYESNTVDMFLHVGGSSWFDAFIWVRLKDVSLFIIRSDGIVIVSYFCGLDWAWWFFHLHNVEVTGRVAHIVPQED